MFSPTSIFCIWFCETLRICFDNLGFLSVYAHVFLEKKIPLNLVLWEISLQHLKKKKSALLQTFHILLRLISFPYTSKYHNDLMIQLWCMWELSDLSVKNSNISYHLWFVKNKLHLSSFTSFKKSYYILKVFSYETAILILTRERHTPNNSIIAVPLMSTVTSHY